MRRLSVAQDRELRHAAKGVVAWRFTRDNTRYAWCRMCGRDATTQVRKLQELKYIDPDSILTPVNVGVTFLADAYLERYPR